MRTQLAAAVGADGDDPRLDDEVVARVGIDLDPGQRAGPIGRRDVDGDRVVVERERADAGRPRLVARLLLPAGPEPLAVEEGVIEHDLAHAAQAAVPEVGHQRVEPLGGDGRIAAALDEERPQVPALDGAIAEVIGAEPVLRPEPQQGRCARHQLGVGGRVEQVVAVAGKDHLPVVERLHLEPDVRARERRLRQELLDRLAQRLAICLAGARRP